MHITDFKTHFRLLRLAKLRGLTAEPLGDKTYKVSSHSRPGEFYLVSDGICPCQAKGHCSHAALAIDRECWSDPEYFLAFVADTREVAMRHRINAKLTKEDKKFINECVRRYGIASGKRGPVFETKSPAPV